MIEYGLNSFASSDDSLRSFLSHASDIDDLLEGLDGVLEHWLHRLHDTESSLHIVNLRLHALDGFHFSCDFDQRLAIV